MVKCKSDVNTPRKRASLTKNRTIARVVSRSNSSIQPAVDNVKVVIRVRPPNNKEQGDNYRNVVKIVDDQMLIFDPKEDAEAFFFHGVQQRGRDLLKKSHKDLQFIFDKVFSKDSTTEEVFKDSTYSLINSLMDGYNCSVFAYGATGAGKTFTMTGTPSSPGITFRTMIQLFQKREELSIEREFELGITYLEVYNEHVKDLLNPGSPLQLREDGKYGMMVAGIKVFKIEQPDELFSLLEQGNKNRTQHPTDANADSSRSHAVFQVYIQMTIKATGEVRRAKLSMIDLAGSERASATGYVGARFTGANINKSLLALGNCINSLADGQRHVPYRDSKLTRLLKDSLGGNCQTVMIANISPSSLSFEDTYNTLKYAMRAKKIKSNMKRNIVNVELHVGQYVKMVDDLQKENNMPKNRVADLEKKTNAYDDLKIEYDKLNFQLENICEIDNKVINEEFLVKINDLIQEKKENVDRQFQLQKNEMVTNFRRRIKEETDARLSGMYTNTPEKKEARRKIVNTIDRFKKQENAIKTDIQLVENCNLDVDNKLEDLIKANPQLKSYVELEKIKLLVLEKEHELEKSILFDDYAEKCALLEKMASILKSCYMHGFATVALAKQYQEVVLDFEGTKNVKWGDIPDSGSSSCAALFTDEDCREQLMTKVLKPAPAKRIASVLCPRCKENNRRAFGTAEKARLMSAKNKSEIRGANKLTTLQKCLIERPPFRS